VPTDPELVGFSQIHLKPLEYKAFLEE